MNAPAPLLCEGAGIERLLVFRALQLGDMLVSVPALRALRAWAPNARITLAGLPWASSFVARFSNLLDDFVAFPGIAGFPEQNPREHELPAFFQQLRGRRFDLALQMHGSGRLSNRIIAQSGATRSFGFACAPDMPEGFVPWPEYGSELQRCLQLVTALGAASCGLALDLPVSASERHDAEVLLAGVTMPFAVIHAGARMQSRRWLPHRFIECGRWLRMRGLSLVLTGAPDEAPIIEGIAQALTATVLCGRTNLGSLAAVLARATVVLTNDTGVSHVAAAMRAPSVVVVLGSDPGRWAPTDGHRHQLAMVEVPCRPCSHAICPIGHPCAHRLSVEAVCAKLDEVLNAGSGARDPASSAGGWV